MFEPNRLQRALGTGPLRERLIELGVGGAMLLVLTAMVVRLPPVFVFAAFVGVAGTILFYARPELGLLAYFVVRLLGDLFYWVPFSVGGLSILEVISGGFTALAAGLFYVELRKVERHPAFGALVVYLIVLSVSAIRGGDLRDALEIIATYMSPFLLLFLVTALFRKPDDWRRVMGLFAWVGVIPLTVSAYHYASGQMAVVSLTGLNRLQGGYENLHNHAHMMALLTTIYAFWYFHLTGGWRRWAALCGAGLAALFLYLSYVRTPQVGLAIFAVLFPILERRWKYLFLVAVGGVVLVASSETMRARLMDFVLLFNFDDVTLDRNRLGSGRMGIWTISMREFLSQPVMDIVLGAGLGGHWEMVQKYVDQFRSVRGGTLKPHNDYLTLLYQLGPVAVVCYIVLQAKVIQYGLRVRRMTRDPFVRTFGSYAASLATLSFAVNFVSNSFVERVTPAMVLWTMAGLLYAQVHWVAAQQKAAAAKVVAEADQPATATRHAPRQRR